MTIRRKQEMFPFRPTAVNICVCAAAVNSLSYYLIRVNSSCHMSKAATDIEPGSMFFNPDKNGKITSMLPARKTFPD